jgi:glycosyltransferase involved in cell wall biosynthesis
MYHFIPPKYVSTYQDYNYKKLEDIPQSVFDDLKQKFETIQSEKPLVTIGLIAYNEENFILGTLCSLAETKCKYPFEIIIVNNNSTDNTQQFIDKCGLKSVQETSQGYPFARQAGLKNAKGKYFISGDTDTIYQPKWAELIVDPLEKDKSIACTYTLHAFYTDKRKYPLSLQFYQYAKLFKIYSKSISRAQLNCGGASMAFRVEDALAFGGYNTKIVRGSDGYIAMQLGEKGKIKMVSSQKAVIYTNMRRTDNDGSLLKAFWIRFKYNIRYILSDFTKQKEKS